ncbi:iron chelate uptake ABC transporter family permease subunit [Oerskovia sp. M15]
MGSGSIVQSGTSQVTLAAPLVVLGLGGLILVAHRLDLLALGDDTATVLGIDVRGTRVVTILLAVLLSATAVTVAGPIGFVGLCAPVIVRLVARKVPGLNRHRVLIPLSGLAGVVVILGADVLLRLLLPGEYGIAVPTGVITTVFGAATLVWLARRLRTPAPRPGRVRPTSSPHLAPRADRHDGPGGAPRRGHGRRAPAGRPAAAHGRRPQLGGGPGGQAGELRARPALPARARGDPRGAALGLAGTVVQAVCRNPLAEPGLLGVTAGAGLGAVAVVLLVPGVGIWGCPLRPPSARWARSRSSTGSRTVAG